MEAKVRACLVGARSAHRGYHSTSKPWSLQEGGFDYGHPVSRVRRGHWETPPCLRGARIFSSREGGSVVSCGCRRGSLSTGCKRSAQSWPYLPPPTGHSRSVNRRKRPVGVVLMNLSMLVRECDAPLGVGGFGLIISEVRTEQPKEQKRTSRSSKSDNHIMTRMWGRSRACAGCHQMRHGPPLT